MAKRSGRRSGRRKSGRRKSGMRRISPAMVKKAVKVARVLRSAVNLYPNTPLARKLRASFRR